MNGSERYLVELEFKRVGDGGIEQLTGKIKQAERGFDAFKRGWVDLRSSVAPVGEMIDGVVRSVWNLGKYGAMAGGAALLAGATYGVTNLNNELEKAEISLGIVFQSGGVASSLNTGLEKARETIAKMRVDAQKLPGEFSELQNIFTMGATPAFRAGASIEQLRDLSAKAMVAGKVTMMDMNQVAREFVLLLEGRAGSHNTFGSKMGLTGEYAQRFNKLDGEKRFAQLSTLLGKYESGLSAYEQTFDAASSALLDNSREFVRAATGPLFESVKGTMVDANAWITEHKGEIVKTATTIGYVIRDAYREGEAAVKHWGPIVYDFAQGAYQRFHAIWYDFTHAGEQFKGNVMVAEPYVKRFADWMEKALSDPNGTIDKALELVKLWAAIKGAQAAADIGGSVLNGAMGLGNMMGAAGLLARGAPGAAASAPNALAFAGAGAAVIAALTGVAAAGWQFSELQNDIHDDYKKTAYARAQASEREIHQMVKEGYSEEMIQKRINEMHAKYIASGQNLAANILDTALAAAQAAGQLRSIAQTTLGGRGTDGPYGNDDWSKPLKYGFDPRTINFLAKAVAEPERAKATDSKHKGGGGGTIQKVEIVVTSNQNPSRIARAVVGHITKLQRMSGQSPDVANYSALQGEG